jgi:hypothetical protein
MRSVPHRRSDALSAHVIVHRDVLDASVLVTPLHPAQVPLQIGIERIDVVDALVLLILEPKLVWGD